MKKALLVTHVSGFVPQFEMNNVRILQEMGNEVHYATNLNNVSYGKDNSRLEGTGIICHQVDFARSPFDLKNHRIAMKQLKKLFQEHEFSLMHCHTPVGAALSRLVAAPYRKRGLKVIYTAHGFHFYKGAPWKYWMMFYPVERFLAGKTDVLITINKEDYERAEKFTLAKHKNTSVYKIDSVGIELSKYAADLATRKNKRKELGVPEDAFLIVSVGELNNNKNHKVIVEALGILKEKKLFYVICGQGIERDTILKQVKKLGIDDRVKLAGFCNDVPAILQAADVMAFPSYREGLGMVAVEALASGLPVISSDNRGTREYMLDGINGFVIRKNNAAEFAKVIMKMYRLPQDKYIEMKKNSIESVKKFGIEHVSKTMEKIYQEE